MVEILYMEGRRESPTTSQSNSRGFVDGDFDLSANLCIIIILPLEFVLGHLLLDASL